MDDARSLCPINLSLEIFGDRWTLLVLRDIIFGQRRYFRELMQSQEGISTNILSDRLRRLVATGILTRKLNGQHKQKALYSLTEKGIQLLPVFVAIGAWGRRFTPVSEELSVRAQFLEDGGDVLIAKFARELRAIHIDGRPPERSHSVLAQLDAAYNAAVRRP